MPTKHARCSASAAYRWINCPGSVALSDQCPDPGSSSYADEGTVAHSLAELKLRHVLHEITDAQYKKRLAKIQQDDYYNGEMDNGIAFGYVNGNLFIKLPSGRKLCYWNTHLKMGPRDGREHIVYMGVNQETKQWGETETYGGKLVENITQAIARDCLAISMQRVAALGYNIVMHVHDEMIVDVPIEDTDALERINACMGEAIPWAPGLPLRGDGYETPFYMKD